MTDTRIEFREARRDEVGQVVALLADDVLGQGREMRDEAAYLAAFDAMQREAGNQLFVGLYEGRVVATYQLTFISGLSLRATRRAQIESVRVASDMRNKGVGKMLLQDAETRARAAGCRLMQLTSNQTRAEALRFYEAAGYNPSHVGFKKTL